MVNTLSMTKDSRVTFESEKTVFVVDDDQGARQSVAALARSMDLHVEEFASAEDFLATVDFNRPGCLITDVRMLGMSGLDLQDELRKHNASLPVILITAYAETPLTVRAIKSGAVTVLEKPCRQYELVDAIETALAQDSEARRQHQERLVVEKRLQTLTIKERQVMDRMIAGKMNKVIASELQISVRTVEMRRHNVFEKMQTDSVAELVKMVLSVKRKP